MAKGRGQGLDHGIMGVAWFVGYLIDAKAARKLRRALYVGARSAGDAGSWATLDVRKILRRYVHKALGKAGGQFAFGRGGLSKLIKSILGV